uniref:Uncharacterized protein n=1 Tax=Arundo donax TaxID=35708 RepID=A0A0A8Z9U3_ARUDO
MIYSDSLNMYSFSSSLIAPNIVIWNQ